MWTYRLQAGNVDLVRLKSSADDLIGASASPAEWLLDTAVARSHSDALASLGQCTGSPDPVAGLHLLVAEWRFVLESDPSAAEHIARVLYSISMDIEELPVEAANEMACFSDALELARTGIFGNYDEQVSALLDFLRRWS